MSRRITSASRTCLLLAISIALLLVGAAPAAGRRSVPGYLRRVEYDTLVSELGDALPAGEGVVVTQVENAARWKDKQKGWAPDPDLTDFEGKTFLEPALPSDHATGVARRFYGKNSMASGVNEVKCYPNIVWALSKTGFLRTRRSMPPMTSRSRVANHSWVGKHGKDVNLEVLKRVDFLVETDDFIQVAGANNGSEVPDLFQGCYNVILIGATTGNHSTGTNALDEPLYRAGRSKPDLVAPGGSTSAATPVVASAAAMLVGFAHHSARDLSRGAYVSPRTGLTICHAETSEVIKAVLMAGADSRTSGKKRDRSLEAQQAGNGLDPVFGAGRLNVYNSYHVLAAGECNSAEDGGEGAGRAGPLGFDYDPAFGGAANSNRTATYFFKAPDRDDPRLKATLAWNIDVNSNLERWDGRATLHDLDLKLYDMAWSDEIPVAESKSWTDNTENLSVELEPGHPYRLSVQVPEREDDFTWDYGLAWRYGEPAPAKREDAKVEE